MTTEREIQPVILRDQGLYTIDDLAAVVLNDARDLVRQKEGAEHPDVKKLWAAIEELAADGLSDDHSEFMLAAEVLADHGYVAFSDGDHGTWVVYTQDDYDSVPEEYWSA